MYKKGRDNKKNYKEFWILIVAICSIFVIFLSWKNSLLYKDNNSNKQGNFKKLKPESDANDNSKTTKPAFYISHINASLSTVCIFQKPSEYDKATIGLMGMLNFYINANSELSEYKGDKVKYLIVNNFEVVKKPSQGIPVFLTSNARKPLDQGSIQERIIPKTLNIPILQRQPANIESWSNYYAEDGMGHISIMYSVKDIDEIAGSDKYSNLFSSIQKSKLTSDNLRSIIAFDIEIKTEDNQVYRRHLEFKMIDGEFIKDNSEVCTIDLNYENQPEKMPFQQIK